MAATILIVACRLAIPWPLRVALEEALPRGGGSRFHLGWDIGVGGMCVAYFILAVLTGLAEWFQWVAMGRFAAGAIDNLRQGELAARRRARSSGSPVRGDYVARLFAETGRFK